MKRILERGAFLLGFLAGGLWFFVCSALGLVWLLVTPGNRQSVFVFARTFCGGVARLMGWRIEVAHRERLDESRPCVFVANHQSIMDLLVFGTIVPRRTVAVAKKEIGKIPLFGWFFRASGNLVIDRGSSEDAQRLLREAARRLKEENLSVWFMPEGHRNPGSALLPFKTGAFRLAAAAGVPIVPVVAESLTAIVDTDRQLARPGRLRLKVLAPFRCDGCGEDEMVAFACEVRDQMQRELDGLRATAPAG